MMRTLFALLAVLVAVAALPARDDKKEEPDVKVEDKGFVKLFNGKDLTGWKVHPKGTGNWKVDKEGILSCSGKASHLFSERGDYKDFHYLVEAKINDKGNSGQYFRTKFEAGFPTGWEAQINATHGDRVKTGSLYPDGRQKDLKEYKELIVLKADHKTDEWFTQEVICKGDHIVIKVNGKTTVDWKDPKGRFKEGHFALQHHDPGCVVQVRKIEVKELKEEK